jgi:hypothetical protein
MVRRAELDRDVPEESEVGAAMVNKVIGFDAYGDSPEWHCQEMRPAGSSP